MSRPARIVVPEGRSVSIVSFPPENRSILLTGPNPFRNFLSQSRAVLFKR